MSHITDLILKPDAATAVFFFSLFVLAAVSVSVLNPPADYKPHLVAPPVVATPGLLQGPQLLREGQTVDAKAVAQPAKS